MIMANPAQTIPSTRAEKERGVPSPGRVQALAKLENINIPKFTKKFKKLRIGVEGIFVGVGTYAGVEEDSPGKPDGRGQVQRLLLLQLSAPFIFSFEQRDRA